MVKVKVKLLRERKSFELELEDKATVKDLVHKLGYTSEDVIVLVNNTPLIEEDILEEGKEYVIMPVASGG